jgi:predicted transcriptional regulator
LPLERLTAALIVGLDNLVRCLTGDRLASYREGMEVHLEQSEEAKLNELAVRTGRGTDELVQEAVHRLLAHDEWFQEQVQIGIDQIKRGEFVEEEEMDARVRRMLQP